MKLSIALVAAALSLAACAEEPTNPGEGLSGVGPSKQFNTDPTLIDVQPEGGHRAELTGDMSGVWIETISLDELACADCSAVHYIREGVELVDLIDVQGAFVCHFSSNGIKLADCAKK